MTNSHADTVSGTPESGLVHVYRFRADGTAVPVPLEQVGDALSAPGGWTWVHVGLADARARTWIAQHAPVSNLARQALSGPDEHIQLDSQAGEIIGVMPDLHQTLGQAGEKIVRFRFVLTDRMLITARHSPVHALELTRRSFESGRRFPTPISFLDGAIDKFADVMCHLSETIADQLDQAESRLLQDDLETDRPQLGRMRLQLAHLHRQVLQLSLLFQRVEPRIAAEHEDIARAIHALSQKLSAVDHDVYAQYERARLLVDEAAGKMAATTNRRLFTLSILTASLLPPTLITGVFGMNTKDLPFQNTDGGAWYALALAAGAAIATFWVLRRLRAL